MPTFKANLDTTQYVQVNTLRTGVVLQANRDAVRVVLNDSKPAKSNEAFIILGGDDPPLKLDFIDTDVWALGTTSNSSLSVTELPINTSAELYESGINSGKSYSSSISITVPANTRYSAKVVHNSSSTAITFVKAQGLFIEYYNGSPSGGLIELAGGYSLNQLTASDYQLCIEYYDGPASGDRIVSGFSELDRTLIVNGGAVIELYNNTDSDITTLVSIGALSVGSNTVPYMLTADTQLESGTEMSDYNGTG